MTGTAPHPRALGDHLRLWRRRRRMSQLDLALEADISQKHLSFVESGRAAPSRAVVLSLAKHLDMPLRERHALLLAAGYAPSFPERPLDDPGLKPVRDALDLILKAHEPYPALAVDRRWTMVAANAAVPPLLVGVAARLLSPPVNVLRLSLDPEGLAPRIVNLAEWRAHLLERLRLQVARTGDAALGRLLRDLEGLPAPPGPPRFAPDEAALAAPLRLAGLEGVLSFVSTVTVFGAPLEVTVSELAIEAFYPADEATAAAFRAGRGGG